MWRTHFCLSATDVSLQLAALKLSRLELILSHPIGGELSDKVLIELIEADVDIGFGLVDDAKTYLVSGQSELIVRVLQDAAAVVSDIERRLQQMGDYESAAFHPLIAELRNEIAAVKSETS